MVRAFAYRCREAGHGGASGGATRWAAWGLCFAALAWGADPDGRLYIHDSSGHVTTLATLDSGSLRVTGRLPLRSDVTDMFVDSSSRYLFVLHNGWVWEPRPMFPPVNPGEITIHDIHAQRLVATIPVGYAATMDVTDDGRYLVCFSQGSDVRAKDREPHNGLLKVVSVAERRAVAEWPLNRRGIAWLANRDLSRVFVITQGESEKEGNGAKAYLTAFDTGCAKPVAEIEFKGLPMRMVLSQDERFLYLFDPGVRGTKKGNGVLHVVNAGRMTLLKSHNLGPARTDDISVITSLRFGLQRDADTGAVMLLWQGGPKDRGGKLYQFHDGELVAVFPVGSNPQFIFRVGASPERLLFTRDRMHYLGKGGSLLPRKVALDDLNGYAGDVIYLSGPNKLAVQVREGGALGVATGRIAFVDLKENRLERVVTAGRGGVKFAKKMSAIAAAFGLTYASAYASYRSAKAIGAPFFYYNVYWPNWGPASTELAASANGEFVYAFNSFSNDVTVIRVADGQVIDHIAVGRGDGHVLRAPGSRYICAYTPEKVTFVDSTTNKVQLAQPIGGALNRFDVDERGGRLFALTDRGVLVFSGEGGRLEANITGFMNPRGMVWPARLDKSKEIRSR